MRRKINLKNLNPLKSLAKIFRPSPTLGLIWVYVLMYLAGQVHPASWALLTQYKFQWSPADIGISLSIVGISTAIVQGGLTRVLIPKLGERRSVFIAIIVSVIAYAAYAYASVSWMMYAILVPASITGIAGPALQSLISRDTPSQEQGELQGALVALASLTAIIGPLIYTELFARMTNPILREPFPGAPYIAAAIISLLSGIIIALCRPKVSA